MANPGLARAALAAGTPLNTDDRNLLEFALARSVGRQTGFNAEDLRKIALANHWRRPRCVNGILDAAVLPDRRITSDAVDGVLSEQAGHGLTERLALRTRAKYALSQGQVAAAGDLWSRQSEPPSDPYELLLVALSRAARGDRSVLEFTQQLRRWRPLDAEAIEIHFLWSTRHFDDAMPRLEKLLRKWRDDPWASDIMVRSTLQMIQQTRFTGNHRPQAVQLYDALAEPFAVHMHEEERIDTWLLLAQRLDGELSTHYTEKVLAGLEPHFPWVKQQLALRAECYAKAHHPLAAKAQAELARFTENEAGQFAYRPETALPRVSARGRAGHSDQ